MFTGIVECMGSITQVIPHDTSASGGQGYSITIAPNESTFLADVNLGDSISCNGTCLTVTELNSSENASEFKVGLSPETLKRTNLRDLQIHDKCNLEKAMSSHTRFGGHMVQGHVDTTIMIESITNDGNSKVFRFKLQDKDLELLMFIIPKGYVCLDGVSLTVVDVNEDSFTIMMVAYTQEKVVLSSKNVGEQVNLEVDQMGKYMLNMMNNMLNGKNSLLNGMLEKLIEAKLK